MVSASGDCGVSDPVISLSRYSSMSITDWCRRRRSRLSAVRFLSKAWLMTIRVSQVESDDAPAKLAMAENALRHASCTASSASARFRKTLQAAR
jgi:hypothetical protein